MTAWRYAHLVCDNCFAWVDGDTATEARAEARANGWPHIGVRGEYRPRDFCSDKCRAEHRTKQDAAAS